MQTLSTLNARRRRQTSLEYPILQQNMLTVFQADNIASLRQLEHVMETVLEHQKTLKHLVIHESPQIIESIESRGVMGEKWSAQVALRMVSVCKETGQPLENICMQALRKLKISGMPIGHADVPESAVLFHKLMPLEQLDELKLNRNGYIHPYFWTGVHAFRPTVLHIDAIEHEVPLLYAFLERPDPLSRLVELRLFLYAAMDAPFPNLVHHAETLKRVFLTMIKYPPYTEVDHRPTPIGIINKFATMPRLEELAIGLRDPENSPLSWPSDPPSFPSLRLLWIIGTPLRFETEETEMTLFDRLRGGGDSEDCEAIIDNLFGRPRKFPRKLEILAIGAGARLERPRYILDISDRDKEPIHLGKRKQGENYLCIHKLRETHPWIRMFDMAARKKVGERWI
ncbi:hypothetical protein ABW19_dt0208443 [Dactylella cylindrospora]|nr:hypothetical protein ABW19_dt0208443 [Dactylella cylindrospora]